MVNFDHASLLIHTDMQTNGCRAQHFRFQAAWMTHPDLHRVIESNWNSKVDFLVNTAIMGSSLSRWNNEVFGHITCKKKIIQARIDGVQRKLNQKFYLD